MTPIIVKRTSKHYNSWKDVTLNTLEHLTTFQETINTLSHDKYQKIAYYSSIQLLVDAVMAVCNYIDNTELNYFVLQCIHCIAHNFKIDQEIIEADFRSNCSMFNYCNTSLTTSNTIH